MLNELLCGWRPLFFTIMFLCGLAAAQRPERYGAGFLWCADGDLQDGGAVEIIQADLTAGAPPWRLDQARITAKLDVRWTAFDVGGRRLWRDVDVYDISVPVQYQRSIGSNWTWSLMLAPGLASDLERVTGEDLRLTVLGLASYRQSPEWLWLGGIYYGQAFGESRVFPAVGGLWTPDQNWTVSAVMPRPGVTYRPGGSWSFSALLQPAGGDWSIEYGKEDRTLLFESWRAGIEARLNISRRMAFSLEAGRTFARALELRDDQDELARTDLESSVYLGAALKIF